MEIHDWLLYHKLIRIVLLVYDRAKEKGIVEMRPMTKEEMNSLKVGDKVIARLNRYDLYEDFEYEETIVLAIESVNFYCLRTKNPKLGINCIILTNEKISSWQKIGFLVYEKLLDYKNGLYFGYQQLFIDDKEIKTEPVKQIVTSSSCKRCNGTGVIVNEFFSYNCSCKQG